MVATFSKQYLFDLLSNIADPEIPVLSIREIGMLRDVEMKGDACTVTLTPTYTGCPAMGIIEADIKALLHSKGIKDVTVRLVYAPAWTTDWMTDEAKAKMKAYGIAPPQAHLCAGSATPAQPVQCPRCNSTDTAVISGYGATACKALYKCNACLEPFEYFKCH